MSATTHDCSHLQILHSFNLQVPIASKQQINRMFVYFGHQVIEYPLFVPVV